MKCDDCKHFSQIQSCDWAKTIDKPPAWLQCLEIEVRHISDELDCKAFESKTNPEWLKAWDEMEDWYERQEKKEEGDGHR
jgi:hypothetical protein